VDFNEETLLSVTFAFDKAIGLIRAWKQPELVQEVIAKRIVSAAKAGEKDPEKLCECALRGLAHRN
jgi:hypothetical protein